MAYSLLFLSFLVCVLGESGTLTIPASSFGLSSLYVWSWQEQKGTLNYDFRVIDPTTSKISVYVLNQDQMDAIHDGTYRWADYYYSYSQVNVEYAHLDPVDIEIPGSNIYLVVKNNNLLKSVTLRYTLELKVKPPQKMVTSLIVVIVISVVSLLICCGIGLCCCFCDRCQNNRRNIANVFQGSSPHDNSIPMENITDDKVVFTTPVATPDGGVIYTTSVPTGNVVYAPTQDPTGNFVYTTAPGPMGNVIYAPTQDPTGNFVYTTAPVPMGNIVYAPTQFPVMYTDQ